MIMSSFVTKNTVAMVLKFMRFFNSTLISNRILTISSGIMYCIVFQHVTESGLPTRPAVGANRH